MLCDKKEQFFLLMDGASPILSGLKRTTDSSLACLFISARNFCNFNGRNNLVWSTRQKPEQQKFFFFFSFSLIFSLFFFSSPFKKEECLLMKGNFSFFNLKEDMLVALSHIWVAHTVQSDSNEEKD